jgi:hypothetical protein
LAGSGRAARLGVQAASNVASKARGAGRASANAVASGKPATSRGSRAAAEAPPRNPGSGPNKAGGDAAQSAPTEGQGVVYLRTDPKTGEQYVGQAKSPERFDARQGEHNRAQGVEHEFQVLGRAEPGQALDALEETHIRRQGGLQKEGGTLANRRHQMREERYRRACEEHPEQCR